MRRNVKYEIAVGLVFITALMFLGYYTIIMGQKSQLMKERYVMKAYFNDAGGLAKKDKVKVKGVESGSVRDILLADGEVLVVMELFNRFTLYENYSIVIRSDAALGGKHVSINPGSSLGRGGREHAMLVDYEGLRGEVDDPLLKISQVIGDNRENLAVAIENIRDITDKINSGQGTLGKLINDRGLHSEADKLVKDLREAIEDTREQAPITSFIRAALTIF
jgi:phospholipid/cholesterol/gamma-HCH transport system substrate-binding protein